MNEGQIILYRTDDGQAALSLHARDGSVWMNQAQLAELFATSVPNISMHISNVLKDKELSEISVIQNYLTTAADGKDYSVTFYALEMILAIGYRVRSPRGTQFRQWAYFPTARLISSAPTVRPIAAQGNALGYNHPRTPSPERAA